jgi:hypothetical protein
MDPAIQIEGVAFEISQEGLEALLTQQGVEVKLSALRLQISAEALAALLGRLLPDGSVAARVSPGGIVIERAGEGSASSLRVEVAVPEVRVRAGEGRLDIRSE